MWYNRMTQTENEEEEEARKVKQTWIYHSCSGFDFAATNVYKIQPCPGYN